MDTRGGQNPRRGSPNRRPENRRGRDEKTWQPMHGKLSEWNCLCAKNKEGKCGAEERNRESDRERDRETYGQRGASETENGAGAREMKRGREQDSEWNSRSNKQRT